jgi:hypothetical protein
MIFGKTTKSTLTFTCSSHKCSLPSLWVSCLLVDASAELGHLTSANSDQCQFGPRKPCACLEAQSSRLPHWVMDKYVHHQHSGSSWSPGMTECHRCDRLPALFKQQLTHNEALLTGSPSQPSSGTFLINPRHKERTWPQLPSLALRIGSAADQRQVRGRPSIGEIFAQTWGLDEVLARLGARRGLVGCPRVERLNTW